MAAKMLTAYYSCGCNSKELFSGLDISEDSSFEKYLNQYNVIFVNMVDFWSETNNITEMLALLKKRITDELRQRFPNTIKEKETSFIEIFKQTYRTEQKGFVVIIDEWDCIFRENKMTKLHRQNILTFYVCG